MRAYRILSGCLLAALMAGSAWGQGMIAVRPETEPPDRVIRRSVMQLDSYHVDVRIERQVATTTIDQVFYNPSSQRIEGEYLFPLPVDSHIDQFKLEIDGKLMPAEMLDAKKARDIYEGIVRAQRDPALMEYYGRGLVRVRVFPIEGHARRTIRLQYTELLKNDAGLTGYRCPLKMQSFGNRPIGDVSIRVAVQSDAALKAVYSPSHDVDVSRADRQHATVGFEAANYLAESDFQLFYAVAEDDIGLNLMSYRDGEEGFFLLLASPGFGQKAEKVANRDVVFVIDTSGSMSGEKIEQARGALKFCIDRLNKGDRFEVVRFSTAVEPLFDGLTEVDRNSRQKATAFVRSLESAGSTAIHEAMLTAVKMLGERKEKQRPSLVIFLTDGRPTVGEQDEEKIVSHVNQQMKQDGIESTRIFCFGVGHNVNTYLLDKMAEQTRAFGQYVLPGEDIEAKVSSFYAKIAHPVLTEMTLDFDGEVKVHDMHPQALPDLFKGDQLVVLGRYRGAGPVKVKLAGKVNGQRESREYDVSFAGDDGGLKQGFIGQLWATRRIGYLLDQMRLNGKDKEIEQEISALATRFGIVTPYTAYLILEDEQALPASARVLQQDDGIDTETARMEMEMLRRSNENLMGQRTGEQAVRGTSSNLSMRQAKSLGASKQAAEHANKGNAVQADLMAGSSVDGFIPLEVLQGGRSFGNRETKYVQGRAFFRNGEQWVDANVSNLPEAKRVQVLFGSDDYFELLSKHKYASAWMSVGRNVLVVFDDVVYEVVDKM